MVLYAIDWKFELNKKLDIISIYSARNLGFKMTTNTDKFISVIRSLNRFNKYNGCVKFISFSKLKELQRKRSVIMDKNELKEKLRYGLLENSEDDGFDSNDQDVPTEVNDDEFDDNNDIMD